MRKPAKLRVCASCEWIFENGVECHKCGFGSYGARFAYGNKCYSYFKTQKPWFDKKMAAYTSILFKQITEGKNNRVNNKKLLLLEGCDGKVIINN